MTTAVDESALVSSVPAAPRGIDQGARNSKVAAASADGTRGDILVVDDEPTLLRGISRLLTDKGYNVVCERDGESALVTFRAREFDVGTKVYTEVLTAKQLQQALGLAPDSR